MIQKIFTLKELQSDFPLATMADAKWANKTRRLIERRLLEKLKEFDGKPLDENVAIKVKEAMVSVMEQLLEEGLV